MTSRLELITTQEHTDIFNSFCICLYEENKKIETPHGCAEGFSHAEMCLYPWLLPLP